LRARLDLQRGISGYAVIRWQIGQRRWQQGWLEDPYLKARVLRGGEHACMNTCRWSKEDLMNEVRWGAITLVPVGKKGYWAGPRSGDPRNSMRLRIEVPYYRSEPKPLEPRKCEGTWNNKTFTETGCGRPAVGRFRVKSGPRKLMWLCPTCAATGV
jgi:hypothetical protein